MGETRERDQISASNRILIPPRIALRFDKGGRHTYVVTQQDMGLILSCGRMACAKLHRRTIA
jgi:hypothetical protein